jgi:hypothetical protein
VVVFLCIKSKTKAGIELIRKPRETVAGIWNGIKSLNGDKVKQMISSVSGAAEYSAGGDRAKHQAGKHGVQATMMVIGSVKFLTNGKEVLDGAGKGMTDLQKFIPDGTTGHPSANALKNAADNGKVVKKIDDDKVLTQNVEGGQNVMVAIEKKADNVDVYKYSKDDYKRPDGTVPDDNLLAQYVEQDLTDVPMPPHATRPPDFSDQGLPDANVSYNPQGRKNIGWNKELNELPLNSTLTKLLSGAICLNFSIISVDISLPSDVPLLHDF